MFIMNALLEETISKETLLDSLYKLRNTLCAYDYDSISNVIFFNNNAVYEFLCEIDVEGGADGTIGDVLNRIEPYIPINIGDDAIEYIMFTSNSSDVLSVFEGDFIDRNKMEFLKTLTEIDTQSEWVDLVNICEIIRSYKVEGRFV